MWWAPLPISISFYYCCLACIVAIACNHKYVGQFGNPGRTLRKSDSSQFGVSTFAATTIAPARGHQ